MLKRNSFLLVLFILISFPYFVVANPLIKESRFLPVDEAFKLSVHKTEGSFKLRWVIADSYYLYKNAIKLTLDDKLVENITLPPAISYVDEFYGNVEVFKDSLAIDVVIDNYYPEAKLILYYQGCTKNFCYPPQQLDLSQMAPSVSTDVGTMDSPTSFSVAKLLWLFILGIGLALTPCVLPMLPLLSSLVLGQSARPDTKRALLLGVTYVQGMAMTYAMLGILAVFIGLPLQIALQSPIVLGVFALLFVGLSLSMFGVFTLQLPLAWQNYLMQISYRQKGGQYLGVFIMGVIAGLVASPCISAPLSAVLLYIAQTNNYLIGGLGLYLLALGIGTPLILITVFGNKILPRTGAWQDKIKTAFGFIMLTVPVLLLSRLISDVWELRLWSLLAVAFLTWILFNLSAKTKLWVRLSLLVVCILAGHPLSNMIWQPQSTFGHQQEQLFNDITSLDSLIHAVDNSGGRITMLDLYADWCVACKEFEKYTFSDIEVQTRLKKMQLLRIDMTKNSASTDLISKKLEIIGLPSILFFDEFGDEIPNSRITGFINAEAFLAHINSL